MIADQNFYEPCFTIFYPTASATVYGQRSKFFMAEHSATAEGENCAYGSTLQKILNDTLGPPNHNNHKNLPFLGTGRTLFKHNILKFL